jgi:hypothetical protein
VHRSARMVAVVSAVGSIGMAEVREAAANCVNTTTGVQVTAVTGQPSSNQTVVCDATPPNPTPASTVVTAAPGSTNVSVTVLPGSVLNTTARAIGVVNNSTILNQGQIRTSGLNAFGISSTGAGSTLTNQGLITTVGSRGFGMDARGSNSTLVNSGTINVSGPNSAGVRSTETTAGTSITNSGTITVTGAGSSPDFASGILFQAGAAGTFVNTTSGVVTSQQDSGVRGADGNIVVRNAGVISGGNGIAINLGNGNNTVEVTAGQINGAIVTGTGTDQFTWSGGIINGSASLGGGSDTATLRNLSDAQLASTPTIDGGTGIDRLVFDNVTTNGFGRFVNWETVALHGWEVGLTAPLG